MLIDQLPPGTRLGKSLGGAAAWSDAVRATHEEGHRTLSGLVGMINTQTKKNIPLPKPIEPPEEGYQQKAREQHERRQKKAARWKARQKRLKAGPRP